MHRGCRSARSSPLFDEKLTGVSRWDSQREGVPTCWLTSSTAPMTAEDRLVAEVEDGALVIVDVRPARYHGIPL